MMPIEPINKEPLSFESCQSDDYLCLDSSIFERQIYNDEESMLFGYLWEEFHPDQADQIQVNSMDSENSSEILPKKNGTQNETEKMVIESSTSESSQNSENQISHYRNNRRKKNQRAQLAKIYKMGSKFAEASGKREDSNAKEERLTSKLTKNLLAFGKKPVINAVRAGVEKEFLRRNGWFKVIEQKDGMTMRDYDRLFRCEESRLALEPFFRQKVLDRELMLSRTAAENKIFYRYYLEVFERNFRKGGFTSISETMMEIEGERRRL